MSTSIKQNHSQELSQASNSQLVMKAFVNACDSLSISREVICKMLGVNPATYSRNKSSGFSQNTKTYELQLQFIRLYRSLYALAGGNSDFMQHWLTTQNKAINGIPEQLVQSIEGLIRTNEYLDAMRGKI
jgi:hypothetical protein